MKAVVFHGVGDIRVDDVPEPKIQAPTDAIVRITASAICGTDLHMIRGTLPGMKPGTILGHEGVGVVEEVGPMVRNLKRGDRVVIPSTIGCGSCNYCRSGYFAQCDTANPNGPQAGTAFFGGPEMTGPFDGLQAEYVRVPYANVGLVKLPDGVTDDQAILLSDIYPTGFFGAHLAEIKDGDIVAVWGCGPVGLFAILSARQMGASRIIAVDGHPSRLDRARALGAEVVNFNEEDPIQAIRDLTGGIGPDRAIDAVGVDAERPKSGPAAAQLEKQAQQFQQELQQIAPQTNPQGDQWKPGDAPSLVSTWAVESLAKAGTLSIIGVYPQTHRFFPIGAVMNKNLTINSGNCNHRKYLPELVAMVASGEVDPLQVLSHVEPMTNVLEAYKQFDLRKPGWVKVELVPGV
ncbi:zinc-dependent alcohol dehydrogenase [Azospirillum rugosum]|uniref:Threonine dehydrogenase-like Zn-dependent dehydrogenase n=1 Tax=Azospirillum rugosum TaxID=416170 RepID=A0ABS4SW01_9PROT|nr:zinc-dependent alcohol dehydrogenase [Azospirillum rugosum]MBP2296243.1 threonine dehydrogenase-like Zn-dependent dehydrogenase [Azospirillum rugosum]MDQ0529764.1 threonine dehydrogenase-like Zn-dependent dehydrogenase [Azospirillum rugosum]